jgi:hypothetical protein
MADYVACTLTRELSTAHASCECSKCRIVDVCCYGLLPQVHLDAFKPALVVWPAHLNGAVKAKVKDGHTAKQQQQQQQQRRQHNKKAKE